MRRLKQKLFSQCHLFDNFNSVSQHFAVHCTAALFKLKQKNWQHNAIVYSERSRYMIKSFHSNEARIHITLAGIIYCTLSISTPLLSVYIHSDNRFLLRRTPVSIFARALLHVCEWLMPSLLLLLVCCFDNRHTLAPSRSIDVV